MESILVMGGSSFVSGSLAKYLIKKGYNVDILTRGLKEIEYNGIRKQLVCDRRSEKHMQEVLANREYDFIFDVSAYTKKDVEVLLSSIDRSKLKKYIFCSSGAVYKPSNEVVRETYEKGENPNWGKYGMDKKEAEDFIIKSGVPYVIFRPTYIYGENNNLYREAYFFNRIKNDKVIPMPYGNNTVTQFIHIDDLVKVFESAMHNKNTCKIYNVTNPEVVSWECLIKTCSDVMSIESQIKKIDVREISLETRSYFPFRDVTYLLSIESLIRDKLYVPSVSLKEGLEKTYRWYKNTKPDIKDVKMNKVDEAVAYE